MATKTWTGAKSNAWSAPGNWTPTGVPAAGDDVVFGLGSGANTLNLNVDSNSLNSFTIEGAGTNTLKVNSNALNVGAGGITLSTGNITIADGAINDTGNVSLGSNTGISGY